MPRRSATVGLTTYKRLMPPPPRETDPGHDPGPTPDDDAADVRVTPADDDGSGDNAGSDDIGHVPVLLADVLQLLEPAPGQTLLDATLGRGGHAAALLPLIPGGTLIGVDRDADNLAFARRRLEPLAAQHRVDLQLHHASFADIARRRAVETPAQTDLLLADLGFASNQMDDARRGFSFQRDGPLDMRLDPTAGTTAQQLIDTLPEKELADLIYRFGEERLSRRIARRLVEQRQAGGVTGTLQLAELCRRCYPPPHAGRGKGKPRARGGRSPGGGIHPATRTFQALRIAVNGEIQALESLLGDLPQLMAPGGRAAIISFHSLEDRPVKQAFLGLQQQGCAQRLTRRPRTADADETADNPRSRSAKLRALRLLPVTP